MLTTELEVFIAGNRITASEWLEISEGKSFKELGIIYGVSRQRMQQIDCYLRGIEKENPQEERKPRKLPKVLSQKQIKKMLSCINLKLKTGLQKRVLIEVMWRGGLRVSEVCNLTVDDVKLDESYLFVQQGKNKVDRVVPIDSETIEWLRKWREIRPESEYFFCTFKGTRTSERYIRQMIYDLSEKAGIYLRDGKEKVKPHPHTFRHTCFTECLEDGFNIREIQELAGHSNIVTTSCYLSVRPEQLKEKIQARR